MLEEDQAPRRGGYIIKRIAILSPAALNLHLVGYIRIRAAQHSESWLKKFTAGIQAIPEILECHRMTGDIDYAPEDRRT